MTHVTPQYLAEQGLSSDFPSRFFDKVVITPSCWFWIGSRRKKGMPYANACRGVWVKGSQTILAHKASWLLHFGPVPEGQCVCHDCPDGDCPWCVNPAHLWMGTSRQNIEDMWAKGRGHSGAGDYFGEDRWNAKLTNEQAEEIRRLYRTSDITWIELSRRFGIAKPGIGRILRGLAYAESQPEPIIKPKHKLTEQQENWVREQYATGLRSQQSIADELGVSQVHISHIVLNRRPYRTGTK